MILVNVEMDSSNEKNSDAFNPSNLLIVTLKFPNPSIKL